MSTSDHAYRPFGTMRFGLAMLVVVSHSAHLGGTSLEVMLRPWGLGNIAVMVFFCLSGYIIAEAVDLFYHRRIGKFLLNRVLRIVPPYLSALLFSILVHLWVASYGQLKFFDYDFAPSGIFSSLNYLSNFLMIFVLYGLGHVGLQPDYPFVRYIWAVRVELHFYISYAILYWIVSAESLFGILSRWGKPIAFTVASLLFLASYVSRATSLNYFSFAPYFMLGISLQIAVKQPNRPAMLAMALSTAMVILHFSNYVDIDSGNYLTGPLVALLVLGYSIIPLARVRINPTFAKADQWLGDLSYPIYLNHYVVTIGFLSMYPEGTAIIFGGCVATSVVASWAVSLLTEPVTRQLRNRIRGVALQ